MLRYPALDQCGGRLQAADFLKDPDTLEQLYKHADTWLFAPPPPDSAPPHKARKKCKASTVLSSDPSIHEDLKLVLCCFLLLLRPALLMGATCP